MSVPKKVTIEEFVFIFGKKQDKFAGGSLYKIAKNDKLEITLIPTIFVKEDFLKFLDEDNLEKIIHDNGIPYSPLPEVLTWDRIDPKTNIYGKTAIILTVMGRAASTFSFTRDQLKYLVYQVTRALILIHNAGYIHRNVSPESICCLPGKKQVCLGGFHVFPKGDFTGGVQNMVFSCIEELTGTATHPSWDMHSLAYSLIVLAGGVLPWMGLDDENEIASEKAEYYRQPPRDLVSKYSELLGPILTEWCMQALSLSDTKDINYQIFLDYLWN